MSPLLRPFELRNEHYNEFVRQTARKYDAVLVDYWAFDAYRDRRPPLPSRSLREWKQFRCLCVPESEPEHQVVDARPGPGWMLAPVCS